MGHRLHVAELYQVKHHTRDYFDGTSSEEVNWMLLINCPGFSWEGNCAIEYATRFEVPRTELANFIAKIAADREGFNKWAQSHDINETADEMIRIIAEWIANSDQRNDFVVLSWY